MASLGAIRGQIGLQRSATGRRCVAIPRQAVAAAPLLSRSRISSGRLVRVHDAKEPAFTAEEYNKAAIGDALPTSYASFMPVGSGKRRAGVILHPTSLPGPYGIGDLGQEARVFVDWLADAGLQVWQVLPLGPPDPQFFSPYSCTDANCGNPLLVSTDELVKDGLLQQNESPKQVPVANINYLAVAESKLPVLKKAAQRLLSDDKFKGLREEMTQFRKAHPFIEDSAIFDVARNLPDLSQMAWWGWPEGLRFRKPDALKAFATEHKQLIDEFIAIQFFFNRQWLAIKKYANDKNIKIVGDMPIYVGGHSADVWSNQKLFELGPDGAPAKVSGVPPDAFSETGQLWGSPLYKWNAHKDEGYAWWCQRMGRAMELHDETRIDHFRGFAGYWAVDGKAETAMGGTWVKGPGIDLFKAMTAKLGSVPIMAEDLGVITTDVNDLRKAIGAPGMVVLQFAWGSGAGNVHLPHNHYENCFVYPGTHDNETTVGWWKGSAGENDKKHLKEYLNTDGQDIAWDLINAGMFSAAETCVIMMQDILRLDNSARMNTPGKAEGNWMWRLGDSSIWGRIKKEGQDLRQLANRSNRLPPGATH